MARRPASEEVQTTCAGSPCAIITGTKARMVWIAPQRLTPSTHFQLAADAGIAHQQMDLAEAVERRPGEPVDLIAAADVDREADDLAKRLQFGQGLVDPLLRIIGDDDPHPLA